MRRARTLHQLRMIGSWRRNQSTAKYPSYIMPALLIRSFPKTPDAFEKSAYRSALIFSILEISRENFAGAIIISY